LGTAFEIATDKEVLVHSQFEGRSASVLDRGGVPNFFASERTPRTRRMPGSPNCRQISLKGVPM
jgi:hypothetical protein